MPLWIALLFLLFPVPALAQGLSGFVSPGPLSEAHADLEGLTGCVSCHTPGEGVSARKCLDCHDEIADDVAKKKGMHASLGERCERCHPDHEGRAFPMVRLEQESFDHTTTGYKLIGAHAEAACADCHAEGSWRIDSTRCTDCHGPDDPHQTALSERPRMALCDTCHDTVAWEALPLSPAALNHDDPAHTDYPLEGAHAKVECVACHADWRFTPITSGTCTDCHDDPHKGAFGAECTSCHTTMASWAAPGFDHSGTDFPLLGEHQKVRCKTCHGSDVARPLAHETCADCHDDVHSGQFVPRTCDTCHTVDVAAFRVLDFDHAATDFPLRGHHLDVACVECHGEGPEAVYADLPAADCASCHDDVHEGRFAPTPCAECHQETGWTVESFDHARTDFPLDGAHVDVACETCHADGYDLPHGSCLDCHADDDPHKGFAPETCTDCHVTAAWADTHFDHATTGFLLDPPHDQTCASCHEDPLYADAEPVCESCHDRPPDHLPGACDDCHGGTAWQPATLGSLGHDVTGFPLHGAHDTVPCASCHRPDLPTKAVSTDCAGCHAADDMHKHLVGFACSDCHVEVDWYRVRFPHQQTSFPLRGAHRLAACVDCHATSYSGTPEQCWRCHETEADPGIDAHRSPGARICDDCHNPFTWEGVRFPH